MEPQWDIQNSQDKLILDKGLCIVLFECISYEQWANKEEKLPRNKLIILFISDNQPMEFGGIVSTSNCLDGSPQVRVKTDKPLVWTLGINM